MKNSCHQLTMDMVDLKKVRAMSKTCKRAKFCSAEHLSQAKLRAAKQARGGRESLTAQQVAHLFRVMLEDLSSAWTAVFLLLCIYLGERCGCTLSARDSWFSGLSSAQPLVRLPKVNAKTTEREIPLEPEFAKLLLHWSQTGLEGTAGSRWPHAGQKLQLEEPVRGKGRLLFPGRKAGGKNLRNYAKPVTSRGLHNKFVQARDIICTQQASARAQGTQHVFDDIVLPRLSSHSCKKTAVTLLKEHGVATSVVSLLTGTTCRVLDEVYYRPSRQKQRQAQAAAFAGITLSLQPPAGDDAGDDRSSLDVFCVSCGRQLEDTWRFCPRCGNSRTAENLH